MNMEVKGIIKKILIYGGLFICVSLAVGIAIEGMIVYLMAGMNGETVPFFSWSYFAEADTYKYGFGLTLAAILLYQVFSNQNSKKAKRMLKGKAKGVESVLENSRFMTDK
ncbi:hypothetical protein CLOSTHATH_05857, partial [Hungatella hathewayi DSM 13479]